MATLDQEVGDSPTINANCDENIHNDDVKCDNSGEICDEKQDDTVERTNILPDQPESEHSNIKIDGKTEIIDGNTDHDNNESQTDQSNLQQAENKSHTELEKCGCLMKRKKVSHKWENTYFQLKNSSLHYGHPSQSETQKKASTFMYLVCPFKDGKSAYVRMTVNYMEIQRHGNPLSQTGLTDR